MRIQPESDASSIVLRGDFNPAIFTPGWFTKNEILSDEDLEQTNINVIHHEIAEFQNEWLKVQILGNRFFVETEEQPFIRLSDLVINTFRQHLSHTPIRMLGINRTVHFDAGSIDARNNIGFSLAPYQPWGEWARYIMPEEGSHDGLRQGGMSNLIMRMMAPDDRAEGYMRVTVEPSTKSNAGVKVSVNDHFQIPSEGKEEQIGSECTDRIMTVLENHYEDSLDRSKNIVDQIMSLSK